MVDTSLLSFAFRSKRNMFTMLRRQTLQCATSWLCKINLGNITYFSLVHYISLAKLGKTNSYHSTFGLVRYMVRVLNKWLYFYISNIGI